MSKTISKYIVTLAAAIAAGSCTSVNLDPQKSMQIHIGASINTSVVDTKAALDYNTTGVNLDLSLVRWDENGANDLLELANTSANFLSGTMGDPNTSSGNWERVINVNPTQYYKNRSDEVGFLGWYPRDGWKKLNSDNTDDTKYSMSYDIEKVTNLDLMVSDFVKGNYSDGVPTIPFKHALCMYNIYAYAVDEETKEEWGNLKTLSLRNLPSEVTVAFPKDIRQASNIDISYSTDNFHYDILGTQADFELFAGLPTSTGTGQSNPCYVGTLLGGSPTEGVLGVTAISENQSTGNSVSIARNFKPGYTYNIFLRFSSKGIINAEVSAAEWNYDADTDYIVDQGFELLTDLSRYGTANSYIVSSANRGYCFIGTVKGNGVNTLTDLNGNTISLPDSDVNLNVDHVEIVRSDAMMKKVNGQWKAIEDKKERAETKMIELISNDLSNGRVMFKNLGQLDADGNPVDEDDYSLQYKGNVKIAAFDAAGNIIWSWHIWITDTPQNQGYSNGYVVLDRNLGAVTTDYSTFKEKYSAWSGLYYQFGRKDPMFRDPIESGDQWGHWEGWENNQGPLDMTQHPAVVDQRTSVAEAHKHPMTYYYDGTQASGEWTSDAANSKHFWGYISDREDIVKTLYDPCPPGYRVPGNHLWENPPLGMTHKEATNGSTFAGYVFNFSMIDTYYPKTYAIVNSASGVSVVGNDRKDASGSNDFVYIGSATPYEGTDDNGYAYHFRYNYNEQKTDYNSFLASSPTDFYMKRSDAYPVRCVFENSSPVVTDLSAAQTANSYVVEKSGFYEFNATVRGNGVTRLNVQGSGARDLDAGLGANIVGIDHIDVLWWQGDVTPNSTWRQFVGSSPENIAGSVQSHCDSNCPVIVMDNGRLVDGKPLLYIRVNEDTYGNVGLAAYDANDNILWSWHIWIRPGIKNATLGDYTIMDRNLGAMHDPANGISSDDYVPSIGLYYQWGRKDPLFQAWKRTQDTDNSNEQGTMAWITKSADGVWTLHRKNLTMTKGTIPESIANPLYFFTSSDVNWQTTYATGAVQDMWGYVGSTAQGNSFAKTMWDPCPPGYRVMQHNIFHSANVANSDDATSFTFPNSNNQDAIHIDSETQITYTNSGAVRGFAKTSGVWFPNVRALDHETGLMEGVDDKSVYTYKIWSATPMNITGVRAIFWRSTNNGRTFNIYQNNGDEKSQGMVVRCQME